MALNKLAEAEVTADPKLSFSQAFTKVLTDPKNRELALSERAERRAAMKAQHLQGHHWRMERSRTRWLDAPLAGLEVASPSTAPADIARYMIMDRYQFGPSASVSDDEPASGTAKRSSSPIADRIQALAGAHSRRHPGRSHEAATEHVLRFNPDLGRAMQHEQAANNGYVA